MLTSFITRCTVAVAITAMLLAASGCCPTEAQRQLGERAMLDHGVHLRMDVSSKQHTLVFFLPVRAIRIELDRTEPPSQASPGSVYLTVWVPGTDEAVAQVAGGQIVTTEVSACDPLEVYFRTVPRGGPHPDDVPYVRAELSRATLESLRR